MKKLKRFIIGIIISLVVVSIIVPILLFFYGLINVEQVFKEEIEEKFIYGDELTKEKIALISLSGVIADRNQSFSGIITPQYIRKILNNVAKDKDVKGVILEINSPGGSAVAAEIIYKIIKEFKETKKIPLISYFKDIATSGAYYIALSSDKIYANTHTITGSIGVIAYFIDLEGLLKNKLEVEVVTIKEGEFKDIGSPFRRMSEEEYQMLQTILNQSYVKFKERIREARKINIEEIESLTGGRIYNANQAKELKLIDAIGDLSEIFGEIKQMAGLQKAKVVEYSRRPGILEEMIGISKNVFNSRSFLIEINDGRILYIWPVALNTYWRRID